MIKKTVIIGLILLFNLALLPKVAFASYGNYSHSKPIKSSIVYDKPDEGDNSHPSGKDRSIEKGLSFTQGKSKSDPDNNSKGPERNYGKSDKPGSTGGVDKADQDGNNGCGNDDDFEDDNEGWCGHKPKKVVNKPVENDCKPNVNKPIVEPTRNQPSGTPTVVAATTTVVTPTVLSSVTKLPQTGNDSYLGLIGNLALALALVLIGIVVNTVNKYAFQAVSRK